MRVFDLHCDTISLGHHLGRNILKESAGHVDKIRMDALGHYTQFFALFSNSKGKSEEELGRIFREQYSHFLSELEENDIKFCRSGKDLENAFAEKKHAAFLSVEGAELLGCSIEDLEHAYSLGVRAVNLTWNNANQLSGSIAEDETRGLSTLGEAFVRRMQELSMLVDVSHLSEPAFWDVIRLSQKPIMASHSNARSICPHNRNLSDAQFLAVCQTGGIVGLNFYRDFLGHRADFESIERHLDHFLSLGGENHLALGGDWDGCDKLPFGMQDGIGALSHLWEFLKVKYSETLLEKIYYKNMIRVVNELCIM